MAVMIRGVQDGRPFIARVPRPSRKHEMIGLRDGRVDHHGAIAAALVIFFAQADGYANEEVFQGL